VFIPPKIRNYFDLKAGDLLKFDIMEQRIVIKIVNDLPSETGDIGEDAHGFYILVGLLPFCV